MSDNKTIDKLLRVLVTEDVSDVHFKVGCTPVVRDNGVIKHITEYKRFSLEQIERIVEELTSPRLLQKVNDGEEVDLGHSLPGHSRFRVNIYHQRGTPAIVMRRIPFDVPEIDELGLPSEVIKRLSLEERGLILVTGVTGSGKSTTLAAMLNHINKNRERHIVTIEDPIEFLHRDIKSTICQREVGIDTPTWDTALRSVFRQDPDVILIGEMRDIETAAIAIKGAETGHLVFSTLHTGDAAESISRIIDIFPASQQKFVRFQLASLLRGVVSQRLILTGGGEKRVLATEVLVHSPTIEECIANEDLSSQLQETMEKSYRTYGMQTFDMSLYKLLQEEKIDMETALAASSNPTELELRIKGIETSSDWRME